MNKKKICIKVVFCILITMTLILINYFFEEMKACSIILFVCLAMLASWNTHEDKRN